MPGEDFHTTLGRLAAELIEFLDYIEDSLAALTARRERDTTVPWSEVRT